MSKSQHLNQTKNLFYTTKLDQNESKNFQNYTRKQNGAKIFCAPLVLVLILAEENEIDFSIDIYFARLEKFSPFSLIF